MNELLSYALAVLICCGALLAVYSLLLERRVRFAWCRFWLIGSMGMAAVIPLLDIPVWTGRTVYLSAPTEQPAPAAAADAAAVAAAADGFDASLLFRGIHLLGMLTLAGVMSLQIVRILRLRRNAVSIYAAKGPRRITVVRTRAKIAPFSFLRTIYIWHDTPADELDAIIIHETSHIVHGHSIERMLMESLKAILWWNPFVWIAAHRLIEIEEYEVDDDVLRQGYDIRLYVQAIFKQFSGCSPDIANGLRDSLTKKRFLMMASGHTVSRPYLRLAATLPVIAGLLCAFGFTARADVLIPAGPDVAKHSPDLSGDTTAGKDERPLRNGPEAEQTAAAALQLPAPVRQEGPEEEQAPLPRAEIMPGFGSGSLSEFQTWVQRRIRLPEAARQEGVVSGSVFVNFVIERDGTLSNVRILRSSHPSLNEEAIRVLMSSPRWIPGMHHSAPVRISYNLPILFRQTGDNTAPPAGQAKKEAAAS